MNLSNSINKTDNMEIYQAVYSPGNSEAHKIPQLGNQEKSNDSSFSQSYQNNRTATLEKYISKLENSNTFTNKDQQCGVKQFMAFYLDNTHDEVKYCFRTQTGEQFKECDLREDLNQLNLDDQSTRCETTTYPDCSSLQSTKCGVDFGEKLERHRDKLILIFPANQLILGYNPIVFVLINYHMKRLQFITVLSKNGELYKIGTYPKNILVSKLFLKVNATFKLGGFCIDPLEKVMSFKYIVELVKVSLNPKNPLVDLIDILCFHLKSSQQTLRFQIIKLLTMLDKIQIPLSNVARECVNFTSKPLNENILKDYDTLIEIVRNQGESVPTQTMRVAFASQQKSDKSQSQNYQGLITDPLKRKLLDTPTITGEFILKTIHPIQMSLDQLDIQSQAAFNGGFGQVKRTEIKYNLIFEDGSKKPVKKTMAIKQARETEKNDNIRFQQEKKLEHEIKILEYIASLENKPQGPHSYDKTFKRNPYIAQSYKIVSDQNPMDESSVVVNALVMEYYFHASLDIFKIKFSRTLSLHTKLYILQSVASGLRLLFDTGVAHLDIKPQNILISKVCVPKITDFGEAVIFSRKKKFDGVPFTKPGRTIPYSAPEYIQRGDKHPEEIFKESYDVFSFGVMMFELIFDQLPFRFTPKLRVLEKKFDELTYTVEFEPSRFKEFGPTDIMQLLAAISFRCMNKDPEERPKIEWLVIILKSCLNLIDKMF